MRHLMLLVVALACMISTANCIHNETKQFIDFYSNLVGSSDYFSTTGVAAVRNATVLFIRERITLSQFITRLSAQFSAAHAGSYNISLVTQLFSTFDSTYQTSQVKNYACFTNADCLTGERCAVVNASSFPAAFSSFTSNYRSFISAQLLENLFLHFNSSFWSASSLSQISLDSLVKICISTNKVGDCPSVYALNSNSTCTQQCSDDADCLVGTAKCCTTLCGGSTCASPVSTATSTCLQWRAQSASIRQSTYVPQCQSDGSFAPMQCTLDNLTCWCVDEFGILADASTCGGNSGSSLQNGCPVLSDACALYLWPTCPFVCKCLQAGCAQPCQGFTCPLGQYCSVETCDTRKPNPAAECIPVGLCRNVANLSLVVSSQELFKDVYRSLPRESVQQCSSLTNQSASTVPQQSEVSDCISSLGTVVNLCSYSASDCADKTFCCKNTSLSSQCPAFSLWKWSDVIWSCDSECSALSTPSQLSYCCSGVCLSMPIDINLNGSSSSWLDTGSALAFNSVTLPPRVNTNWFGFTQCLYLVEMARLSQASIFYATPFIPRCDFLGRFEPVQCADQYGLCWCVDLTGNPLTTPVRGNPNCSSSAIAQRPLTSNYVNVCSSDSVTLNCNPALCYYARCFAVPTAVCRVYPCGTSCSVQFVDPNTNQLVNCAAASGSSCLTRLQQLNDSSLRYYAARSNVPAAVLQSTNWCASSSPSVSFWSQLSITLDSPHNASAFARSAPSRLPTLCSYTPPFICNVTNQTAGGRSIASGCQIGWFANRSSSQCSSALLCGAYLNSSLAFSSKSLCENTCFGTFQITVSAAIPSCNDDGSYASTACDPDGQLCWCVSSDGTPVAGSGLARSAAQLQCGTNQAVANSTCPNGRIPTICDPQVCVTALQKCGVNPLGTLYSSVLTCAMDACGDCSPQLFDLFGNSVGPLTCAALSRFDAGCWSFNVSAYTTTAALFNASISGAGVAYELQIAANASMYCGSSVFYNAESKACDSISTLNTGNSQVTDSSCVFGYSIASQCQGACETYVACQQANSSALLCLVDPCVSAVCKLYPEAICRPDQCTCQPRFYDPFSFTEVDCNQLSTLCWRKRALMSTLNQLYADGLTFDLQATQTVWSSLKTDPANMCDSYGLFKVPQCNDTDCWCVDTYGQPITNMTTNDTSVSNYASLNCATPLALVVDISFSLVGNYYVSLFSLRGAMIIKLIAQYFLSFLSVSNSLLQMDYSTLTDQQLVKINLSLSIVNETVLYVDLVSAADLIASAVSNGFTIEIDNATFTTIYSSMVKFQVSKQAASPNVEAITSGDRVELWVSNAIVISVVSLGIIISIVLSAVLIVRSKRLEAERARNEAQLFDVMDETM